MRETPAPPRAPESPPVTEDEWITGCDSQRLAEFLWQSARLGDRKARLFACACCARLLSVSPQGLAREAVDVAERVADGLATAEDLRNVRSRALNAISECKENEMPRRSAERTVLALAVPLTEAFAARAAVLSCAAASWATARVAHPGAMPADHSFCSAQRSEQAAQAALLRCLFRNPFRPPPVFDAAWRTYPVLCLAQLIDREREFDRLGSLADALEAAGGSSDEMVAHCRSGGPHARGCWVVDLILGKA